MKIETQDGATFTADTPEGIVSQMRRDQWSAPARKTEYMSEVAERVGTITGQAVDTASPMRFLASLQRADFLRITDLTPEQASLLTTISVAQGAEYPAD